MWFKFSLPFRAFFCSFYMFSPFNTLIFAHLIVFGEYVMYVLTAVGLTPGGSSTVHIYTQTTHRTTQLKTLVGRLSGIRTQSGQTKNNDELTAWKLSPNWEECGPCPIFACYALVFALNWGKARKSLSQGSWKMPVGTKKTEYTEQNIHNNNNI